MNLRIPSLLLVGCLSALSLQAQRPSGERPENKATKQAAAPKTQQGLFTVTHVGNDWFFDIPDSLLGKPILAVTRYTSTPASSAIYGGEMTNQQIIYWEKATGNRMLLRAQLLTNVADSTDQIARAIKTSNETPIIGTFKIESDKGKKSKIKVTQFFTSDVQAFSINNSVKMKFGLSSPVGDASYINEIKTFPINTEIRTIRTWNSRNTSLPASAATGRVTFGLNISFIALPEKPMQQRLFDPRVGYFTDAYTEFSDFQQRTQTRRFITRWRLEPKDSVDKAKMQRGELVEPKKQIVYYIDPATPKQWVPYLIQGVNDWQKAFEQAGFKNAIVGKEWPKNDSTMSMEDARFSVIRYYASPISNAYGPQVHDPRTGEILESHIGWYHNIMELLRDWYLIQASPSDTAARNMRLDENLMGELIRFVSSHEVGHTLGLRHNFGSSSTVPVEKLRDKAWVEAHGHTPSIMDYARFNYVAQPEDHISRKGLFPRIGDYDRWAIEWGYKPTWNSYDGISDRWEREQMVSDSLANNPRLKFGDGESMRIDPRNQTEDLGDNPIKASNYGIKNLKFIIKQVPQWTYQYNDIYNENAEHIYQQIMSQFSRYLIHVLRNIGGTYSDFQTAGSTKPRYIPTPASRQRAALHFLNEQVLTEPVWLRSESYIQQFSTDPQHLTVSLGNSIVSLMVSTNLLEGLKENYPVSSYLREFTDMLFAELPKRTSVSVYRRALQRKAVQGLVSYFILSNTTSDARAYVFQALENLQKQLAAASNVADVPTRLHYKDLNHEIQKVLVIN